MAFADVYYAVGQNTDDHKTGTPSVSISSGVATFSTAQTAANFGMGDRVAYSGGGSLCYLKSKISTTQWNVVTVVGGTPADNTSSAVSTITHEYLSLGTAISGFTDTSHLNTADLTGVNSYAAHFCLYYDTSGVSTALTVASGIVTNESCFLHFYTPWNTSTECNQTQRHSSGVWTSAAHNFWYLPTGNSQRVVSNQNAFVWFEGVQIHVRAGYRGNDAFYANNASGIFKLSDSLIVGEYNQSGVDEWFGLMGAATSSTVRYQIWNNVFEGWTPNTSSNLVAAIYFSKAISSSGSHICNNTFVSCLMGIDNNLSQQWIYAVNNLFYGCSAPMTGTYGYGTDYNATDKTSLGCTVSGGGNTHDRLSQTFSFVDATNHMFSLAANDTGAKDFGLNLTAVTSGIAFSGDIVKVVRTEPWDIGAFAVVSVAGADEYFGAVFGSRYYRGMFSGGARGM